MLEDKDYKALSILFIALMSSVCFFSFISIAIHFTVGVFIKDANMGSWFFLSGIFITSIVILGQRYRYEIRIRKLGEQAGTNKEKLTQFRSILITHIAVCELFAIIGIMCFILFGQWLFFLFVGMSLVEMAKKFPLRSKVDSILNSFSL